MMWKLSWIANAPRQMGNPLHAQPNLTVLWISWKVTSDPTNQRPAPSCGQVQRPRPIKRRSSHAQEWSAEATTTRTFEVQMGNRGVSARKPTRQFLCLSTDGNKAPANVQKKSGRNRFKCWFMSEGMLTNFKPPLQGSRTTGREKEKNRENKSETQYSYFAFVWGSPFFSSSCPGELFTSFGGRLGTVMGQAIILMWCCPRGGNCVDMSPRTDTDCKMFYVLARLTKMKPIPTLRTIPIFSNYPKR